MNRATFIGKKKIATVVVLGLVIVVGLIVFMPKDKNDTQNSNSKIQLPKVTQKACGVLDETDAKKILGANIEQSDSSPTKNTSPGSQDMKPEQIASVCSYSDKSNPNDLPVMVTVLPLSEEAVKKQIDDVTKIEGVTKSTIDGVDYYYQSSTDQAGNTYYRIFAGYRNALVTVSTGDSQKEKIQELFKIIQARIDEEKE